MITSTGLFGCFWPVVRINPTQQVLSAMQIALYHQNLFMIQPSKTLPEGIFWDRTGGKTHRVTIRREPQVVIDLSGLGMVA